MYLHLHEPEMGLAFQLIVEIMIRHGYLVNDCDSVLAVPLFVSRLRIACPLSSR